MRSNGGVMRIVLDTNTVISGLLWRGAPRLILDAARSHLVDLYTSTVLLAELQGVLHRPKFARVFATNTTTAAAVYAVYTALARIVAAPELVTPVSRDPDDDAVLACAVAVPADAVVSGDADLLTLGGYAGIPILRAPTLLARLMPHQHP